MDQNNNEKWELFLEFIQPDGQMDNVFLGIMLMLSAIALISALVAFWRSLKRSEEISERYVESRAEVMPSVDDVDRELTGRADHITETIPPMLLVIGLLGTFIGVGLAVNSGAEYFVDAGAELKDFSEASQKMAELLKNVGFQFKTSVWGIFGNVTIGLVATFFVVLRKMRARTVYKSIVEQLKELQEDKREKEEERETLAAKVQTAHSVNLAALVGRLDAMYQQMATLPEAAITMRQAANEMAAAGAGLQSSVGKLDGAIHDLSADNKKFLKEARTAIEGATDRLTMQFGSSMENFKTTVSTTLKKSAGTISDAGIQLAGSVTSMEKTIRQMGEDNKAVLRDGNQKITSATNDLGKMLETSMGSFQEANEKATDRLTKQFKASMTSFELAANGTLNKMTSDLATQTKAIEAAVDKSRESMDTGLGSLNTNVTKSLKDLETQLDGTLADLDSKLDGRLGALQDGISSMTDTTGKLLKVMMKMDGMNAEVRRNLAQAQQHMEKQAKEFLKGRNELVESVGALYGAEFDRLARATERTNQLLSETAPQRTDARELSSRLVAIHAELSQELGRLERMERDLGALKQLQHEANKGRTEHPNTVAKDDRFHR